MKPILRPAAAAALVCLALAPGAMAQVLTTAEVRTLMANQQPEDHTRLQAHFAALSARYATDAEQHKAFARSASGATGASAAAARHHERMAELATESARITSELAVHHQTLAAGQPSTAPRGAEKFEAGAGAPAVPSERRLAVLAAGASRPSEHGQVREYYLMLARQYDQSAKDLRFMAQMYRGRSHPSEHEAVQCDRLAKLASGSASEARALAREHQ